MRLHLIRPALPRKEMSPKRTLSLLRPGAGSGCGWSIQGRRLVKLGGVGDRVFGAFHRVGESATLGEKDHALQGVEQFRPIAFGFVERFHGPVSPFLVLRVKPGFRPAPG